MNFLAHLLVSNDTTDHRIGNFIADFIRHPTFLNLPLSVQLGVRQHRAVDAFTDRHPVVHQSIGRISKQWGWFSGIIIDVYYDHLLARDWSLFCQDSLRDFTRRMYLVVGEACAYVDPEAKRFFHRVIEEDLLYQYRTIAGIEDTLTRISKRIAQRMPHRAVPLQDAMPMLMQVDGQLHDDFRRFFPQLFDYAGTVFRFPEPAPNAT